MVPHVLCLGGEDHSLRVSFLLALRARGFRVTAASSGNGEAFEAAGLPHHSYRFDRFDSRGGDLAALRQIGRLVAEIQPDLIQTFDTKPNLLAPLALRGAVPVVRTINGMGWTFSDGGAKARLLRPVYRALQRAASRWTAATVFQNRDDKAYFEQHRLLGAGRVQLIRSSGIDVSAFVAARDSARPRAALRQMLGLEDAEIVITVGRLTRQKGIATLLRAASLVAAKRPAARFLLVGPRDSEGPFAISEAEIDAAAPHVVALGARRDVAALLNLADLFVMPTEYREGVPRVLLEAGLAGLPIVATRMPGCNDVVTDGWNGRLVAPADPEALAASIVELLGDKAQAQAMGRRSIGFVAREFALDGVVDRYDELYRQVLEDRGHREPGRTVHRRVGQAAMVPRFDGEPR
jgi:glycosyltransferase involved in cell wall biosynthesis